MKKENTTKKGFLYQILVETKKLFTSKFMIIMIALILLFSIATPIIQKITSQNRNDRYYF
jgi:hypothetical protein